MQKFLMALTTAAFVVSSGSAQAALILGSQAFVVDFIKPQNGNLAGVTEFTNLTFVTKLDTSDGHFTIIPDDTTVDSTTLTMSVPGFAAFEFGNAEFGFFAATAGTEILNEGGFRNIRFDGAFTPGSLFGGLEPTTAVFRLAFTQSGNSISGTATLSSTETRAEPGTPGIVNPEPASIAMFGTMCIPLALGAFRRRQKAAQAAV